MKPVFSNSSVRKSASSANRYRREHEELTPKIPTKKKPAAEVAGLNPILRRVGGDRIYLNALQQIYQLYYCDNRYKKIAYTKVKARMANANAGFSVSLYHPLKWIFLCCSQILHSDLDFLKNFLSVLISFPKQNKNIKPEQKIRQKLLVLFLFLPLIYLRHSKKLFRCRNTWIYI